MNQHDAPVDAQNGGTNRLITAATAVINRWHSRDWKDKPTADYMNELRDALAEIDKGAGDAHFNECVFQEAIKRLGEPHDVFEKWHMDEGELRRFCYRTFGNPKPPTTDKE